MSIAFSRSIRSLRQDSGRRTLVALVVAAVLLDLWIGWLTLGQIPIYVTSREWQVERGGTLLVQFSPGESAQIHPGQDARLTLDATGGTAKQVIQAKVHEVADRALNFLPPDTVRLSLSGTLPQNTQSGEVQVSVEQISPLTALTRAANQ